MGSAPSLHGMTAASAASVPIITSSLEASGLLVLAVAAAAASASARAGAPVRGSLPPAPAAASQGSLACASWAEASLPRDEAGPLYAVLSPARAERCTQARTLHLCVLAPCVIERAVRPLFESAISAGTPGRLSGGTRRGERGQCPIHPRTCAADVVPLGAALAVAVRAALRPSAGRMPGMGNEPMGRMRLVWMVFCNHAIGSTGICQPSAALHGRRRLCVAPRRQT